MSSKKMMELLEFYGIEYLESHDSLWVMSECDVRWDALSKAIEFDLKDNASKEETK